MDAPSGDRSSPRSRQLQGPRPPRLAVSKDSHKVRKPPVAPQRHPQQQQQVAQHQQQYQHQHHHHQQQQARQPVIIYDASPKVIHTKPGDFMALVQRLTGPGSTSSSHQAQFDAATAAGAGTSSSSDAPPQPMDFEPREFLLSPTAALSPAARLAAIERSVRPLPPHAPAPLPYSYGGGADDDFFLPASASSSAFAFASADLDGFAAALGGAAAGRPGILSPAALPPAASTGLFSPLPPLDPSCLSWLSELSPFLHSAGTRAEQQHAASALPFAPSPRSNLLLATPTMPSPATVSVLEFLSGGNFFPDL